MKILKIHIGTIEHGDGGQACNSQEPKYRYKRKLCSEGHNWFEIISVDKEDESGDVTHNGWLTDQN